MNERQLAQRLDLLLYKKVRQEKLHEVRTSKYLKTLEDKPELFAAFVAALPMPALELDMEQSTASRHHMPPEGQLAPANSSRVAGIYLRIQVPCKGRCMKELLPLFTKMIIQEAPDVISVELVENTRIEALAVLPDEVAAGTPEAWFEDELRPVLSGQLMRLQMILAEVEERSQKLFQAGLDLTIPGRKRA